MARKTQQTAPRTFEAALAELETILSDIEGGDVPLEESLVKYERGQFLIKHCRGVLERAEKQIEQLGKGEGEALRATPMSGLAPKTGDEDEPAESDRGDAFSDDDDADESET
jgi:exodeoxyribonuclease VII small subunit